MHEIDKCNYNYDRKNKYQVKMMMMLMILFLINKSALVQSPFFQPGQQSAVIIMTNH